MNHIRKFNESVLGDDTLNLQITRSEYDLLKYILDFVVDADMLDFGIDEEHIFTEDEKVKIEKVIYPQVEDFRMLHKLSLKDPLIDMDYLNYIILRLKEEFKQNNI